MKLGILITQYFTNLLAGENYWINDYSKFDNGLLTKNQPIVGLETIKCVE